jgi:uncharacterized membrane protein required for colicin V production
MNWLDIVMVVLVLGTTFLGFKIGLLRALFLFVAFVLGILVSVQAAAAPPLFVERFFRNPDLCYLVVLTLVFTLVFVGINIVGGVLYKALSLTPLKWIDSWIGIFLGFLVGILLAGLVIIYLSRLPDSGSDELLKESFLAPILRSLINRVFHGAVGKDFSVAFCRYRVLGNISLSNHYYLL